MNNCSMVVVDIGGTKLRISHSDFESITNNSGECEIFESFLLRCTDAVTVLINLIRNYINHNQITPDFIVIGLPASFDADMNLVYRCNNIPQFEHKKLRDDLEKGLGLTVYLEHDAVLLLEGERSVINEVGQKTILGVFLGTGIGGAVIRDDRPYRIPKIGFELGHIPIHGFGKKCICGKYDCAEAYASGHVLTEISREHDVDIKNVFSLWNDSNQPGSLKDFIRDEAFVIATAAALFGPSCIIIGGGIPKMQGFPKSHLEKLIRDNLQSPFPSETINICWASLGDNAMFYGARRIVKNREEGVNSLNCAHRYHLK